MDVIKALKDGWTVLGRNPTIFVPAFIVALLTTCLSSISPPEVQTIPEMLSWLSLYILITILVSLLTLFLGGMIVKMVYDSTRRKLSLSEAAKFVLSKYITLLVASIVFVLITVAGFIALIIPGIFLAVKLIFYEYAILIDNKGVSDSLNKSWKIVKGKWWEVFGLLLILSVISFAAVFLGGILSGLSEVVFPVFYFLIILFIFPWYISSLTFAYLQMRKK